MFRRRRLAIGVGAGLTIGFLALIVIVGTTIWLVDRGNSLFEQSALQRTIRIAAVELRFKVVGNDLLVIKPKAYRDGKPLVREKDGTFLTDIPDYKDSVKLDALVGADGRPVKLTEKDVLEYWLAATDNCEPDANVGESAHKKVRLTPAIQEPQKKQEQANQQQQRKREEDEGQHGQAAAEPRREVTDLPIEPAFEPLLLLRILLRVRHSVRSRISTSKVSR